MQYIKVVKQEMNDGITESPYFSIEQNNCCSKCIKVGTFPLNYAVIQSFISCFTTFNA